MKKLIIGLAMTAGCFIYSQTSFANEGAVDVIVKFKEDINIQLINNYSEDYRVIPTLNMVSLRVAASDMDKLADESEILYVEKDDKAIIDNYDAAWGYRDIQTPRALESGLTGKGIKVGIVDTGIDSNHPDLVVAGGHSFVTYTDSYIDDEGHGTHIAGVIAALKNDIGITGIAPEVSLYALKAFDSAGESRQSDLVASIEWAIVNKLDILNLSFTSDSITKSLEEAIIRAYDSGIFIVASAGNFAEGAIKETDDVQYPARIPQVIAVGSINAKLSLSDFSYYGPSLDFVAPGDMIYSSYLTSKNNYIWMSGTSMATPYVVGALALYKEAYPDKTIQEIEQLAKTQSIDLGAKGFDSKFGFGLIQAPFIEKKQEQPKVANPFSDVVAGDWYAEAVLSLASEKIITGYLDNTFKPNAFVSRAEAVTMLMRVLQSEGEVEGMTFPDVSEDYYAYRSIELAVKNNIIKGLPDGTFGVSGMITRGDTALILQRSYLFEEVTSSALKDVADSYNSTSIHTLYSKGYITGYVDGTFKPNAFITRAEFANILYKIKKDIQSTESME